MNSNKLTVKLYDSAGVEVNEPDLRRAEGVTFATYYPGGLFGEAEFTVPRDVTKAWNVKAGQRVKFYNGLSLAYEGEIQRISYNPDRAAMVVNCLGYWGAWLMRNQWRKRWADTRLDESAWVYNTTVSGAEKCDTDRQNRIRFTPKAVAWVANQYANIGYTAPTGQTIKRVTFGYNLQEGAQQWKLGLSDYSIDLWGVTATGTSTADITLATPASRVNFYFIAQANQTGVNDGTIYGEITNVTVYTETGAINVYEIAVDVAAKAGLSADTAQMDSSLTYSLVPFIVDPPMTYADILTQAASYGGPAAEALAVGLRESDKASDGKPLVYLEKQPAITDYDLAVRLDEPNVSGDFAQNLENVTNWVTVHYTDVNGRDQYITPDDDAALKDTASIALWGQRETWLDVDTTSATTAKNYGVRYLAQHKDLQWSVEDGIAVIGYIRGKTGTLPASEIRAGMRLKVENYLADLNGSGLTLLITATSYDDTAQTCQMQFGTIDTLIVRTAQPEPAATALGGWVKRQGGFRSM